MCLGVGKVVVIQLVTRFQLLDFRYRSTDCIPRSLCGRHSFLSREAGAGSRLNLPRQGRNSLVSLLQYYHAIPVCQIKFCRFFCNSSSNRSSFNVSGDISILSQLEPTL